MLNDLAPAVQLTDLCKEYGGQKVLNKLSLTIPAGGIFGLLGPNGAGKTTLMKILAGLVTPSGGTVAVFGQNTLERNKRIKGVVGLAPQDNNMERELTVEETLQAYARLFEVPERNRRIEEIIHEFSLQEMRKKVVRSLSGGMMRRALIARTLLPRPELLLLDEPTVGLDPDVRHEIWAMIRKLASEGKTIILTTHYMDEAETLCAQIAMLKAGELAFLDTPAGIRSRFSNAGAGGQALEALFLQLAKGSAML